MKKKPNKKKCCKCKRLLSLDSFYKNKSRYDGLSSDCKECSYKYHTKWNKSLRSKNLRKKYYKKYYEQGKVRKWKLKQRYNLTLEQYDKMFIKQNGVCAICGVSLEYLKANVDHDHKTDKVRGLLCSKCNTFLAALDDKAFLNKAIQYLSVYE